MELAEGLQRESGMEKFGHGHACPSSPLSFDARSFCAEIRGYRIQREDDLRLVGRIYTGGSREGGDALDA